MGKNRIRLMPLIVVAPLLLTAGACQRGGIDGESSAPPRSEEQAPTPQVRSLIAVPISADGRSLQTALERAIPRTLWTINKSEPRCVAPQRVNVFGRRLAITPAIRCTIIGQVTRGPLRIRGEGEEIIVDVPLQARISARDVGGVLRGETATGSALARARVRVELRPDWTTRGTARIEYDWTSPPGIDFLGQRITFTEQADARLAPVVRDVEREVAGEIARLNIREQASAVWRQSFTTLELNRENPPVWMRLTPQRILYGGYAMDGQRIRLNLALEAITETFVANRPADAEPTALPPLVREAPRPHLDVFVPVIADYAQLEPVILRALQRRSARPIDIPGIGAVRARFDQVTAYGAPGGRIAVGITLAANPVELTQDVTRGRIWMTAVPVNQPGSAEVRFTELSVTGDTDGMGGDLLLRLGNSPGFSALIADALTQNFSRDLNELQGKIRRAIDQRREGDFVIRARADRFETGRIRAYGNGLYLPVRMVGAASVDYRPPRAAR